MELINFSKNNAFLELAELENSEIDLKEFYKLIKIVKLTFIKNNFNTNNINIRYQRLSNANSILAIKVMPGEDDDLENYMVNGCKTTIQDNKVFM